MKRIVISVIALLALFVIVRTSAIDREKHSSGLDPHTVPVEDTAAVSNE